jgi:hypothetical protein
MRTIEWEWPNPMMFSAGQDREDEASFATHLRYCINGIAMNFVPD